MKVKLIMIGKNLKVLNQLYIGGLMKKIGSLMGLVGYG